MIKILSQHLLGCLLLLSLNNVTTTAPLPQESDSNSDWWVIIDEFHMRLWAVTTVMPDYPEEAIKRGVAGVTQVKIGIGEFGKVTKIKVQPGTDPLIKKALVDAVKRWTFRSEPDPQGLNRYILSRLTFHFIIDNGEGRVEMYDPPVDAPAKKQIKGAASPKESREWKEWEEVWTTKKSRSNQRQPQQTQ